MNFIKDIFNGKKSEEAHRQLKRFGKGIFDERALIEISKKSKFWKIKTSFEFVNELVLSLAETLKNKTKVRGAILSTRDINKEINFPFTKIKKFLGIKMFFLDCEISKEDIKKINEKFPDSLMLFSFSTDSGNLKIKVKSPKSAKPSGREKEPKADFCFLETSDKKIVEEFAFDVPEFKNLKISHKFIINEIIIPQKLKKEDFSVIREKALRKGKIIREIEVDGKKIVKEKEFII